jgi:hypothetical protein
MSGGSVELDQSAFDYLLKHDVSGLFESLCQRLIIERPVNPLQGLSNFINAKRCGDYTGGCVVLGSMPSGCWLRVFDSTGSLLVSFDRLPVAYDGAEVQLMASSAKEKAIFIAAVMPFDEFRGKTSAPIDDTSCNKFLLKLDLSTGTVVASYDLGKPILSVSCLREKNLLWVTFKTGGGLLVQCSNGTILKELALPACQAIIFHGHSALALTSKSIEWRDAESLQLETVSHLPDSMVRACTFAASQKHLWCTSANADGSANFIGVFDFLAKSVTFLPPPTAVVAPDHLRGGCWHLTRTANSCTLTMTTEKGSKVMTVEAPRFKKAHMVVDKGCGALWIWRLDESGDGKITLYDPLQGTSLFEGDLPIGVNGHLCMLAL